MWTSQLKSGLKMRKQKRICYSESFKWKVVQEVITGKFSKEQARKVYGIRSNCSILYWMRLYSGNTSYRSCKKVGSFADMPHSKELEKLKNKVSCLEEELRLANLRADLWQKLIEVAEENLNIDVKKKSGAQLLKVMPDTTKRAK
jgi:transposase-like protein